MSIATSKSKPAAPKLVHLQERVYGADIKVDREGAVIRGVRVIGTTSKNGREYPESTLRKALPLYEGAQVNIDHRSASKSMSDRAFAESLGVLQECVCRDGAIYADLHYLKAHPMTEMVLERAERFPKTFGLSHDAEGTEAKRGGKRIVESIERVNSVDVVLRPATNESLFESEQNVKTTFRELLEAWKPGAAKLFEDAMGPDGMALPVEALDPEGDSDDQIKGAFEQAIVAAFRDDSLDMKATLAKIKDILGAYEKLSASPETPAEETPVAESEQLAKNPALKTLLEEFKTLKRDVGSITKERDQLKGEKSVRALLESQYREVTDVRVKALLALQESDRKDLIATWPKVEEPGRRPARSAPLRESEEDSKPIEIDGEAFARRMRA